MYPMIRDFGESGSVSIRLCLLEMSISSAISDEGIRLGLAITHVLRRAQLIPNPAADSLMPTCGGTS